MGVGAETGGQSVVIEETIEHLDFPAPCSTVNPRTGQPICDQEATHQGLCVGCGEFVAYLCDRHAVTFSTNTRWARHRPCGTQGPYRDILRVVLL